MRNVVSLVRALRRAARDQQRMLVSLEKALPALDRARRNGTIARRLRCPRCSRRFALPMNLGRHLKATHGRAFKRAA
jgi:uncharacterized C2H2 Zn-finger protein